MVKEDKHHDGSTYHHGDAESTNHHVKDDIHNAESTYHHVKDDIHNVESAYHHGEAGHQEERRSCTKSKVDPEGVGIVG